MTNRRPQLNGETVIPPYEPKRYPLGLAASLVAGALSGLLGIGGGPIKVPVMYIFMDVPLMVATATSNFMIGVTAAASAIVYYRRGDILVEYRRAARCRSVPGIAAGRATGPAHSHEVVVYLLVGVMFYLCRASDRSSAARVRYERATGTRIRPRRRPGAAHRGVWVLLHHAGRPDRLAVSCTGRIPLEIERAGVLLMLATPVVRVIVACFLFFREKDWKYGWISLGVLVILMLGSVFGIGEH